MKSLLRSRKAITIWTPRFFVDVEVNLVKNIDLGKRKAGERAFKLELLGIWQKTERKSDNLFWKPHQEYKQTNYLAHLYLSIKHLKENTTQSWLQKWVHWSLNNVQWTDQHINRKEHLQQKRMEKHRDRLRITLYISNAKPHTHTLNSNVVDLMKWSMIFLER